VRFTGGGPPPVLQQRGALRIGNEGSVHRGAPVPTRNVGFAHPRQSVDAYSTKAVETRKRKSAIVEICKGTLAVFRFCRNPQKRISVKARIRAKSMNELKITWF
jgi:hypothetical protein